MIVEDIYDDYKRIELDKIGWKSLCENSSIVYSLVTLGYCEQIKHLTFSLIMWRSYSENWCNSFILKLYCLVVLEKETNLQCIAILDFILCSLKQSTVKYLIQWPNILAVASYKWLVHLGIVQKSRRYSKLFITNLAHTVYFPAFKKSRNGQHIIWIQCEKSYTNNRQYFMITQLRYC